MLSLEGPKQTGIGKTRQSRWNIFKDLIVGEIIHAGHCNGHRPRETEKS